MHFTSQRIWVILGSSSIFALTIALMIQTKTFVNGSLNNNTAYGYGYGYSSSSSSGCSANAQCNDSNVCTDDVCTSGVCINTNNQVACATDNNECTEDVCWAGSCNHFTDSMEDVACGSSSAPSTDCKHYACGAGACVYKEKTTCTCATPSGGGAFLQNMLLASMNLAIGKSAILLASAGVCTSNDTTSCNFADSCGKVEVTNTWSGPGCCDGGGTKVMILTADPGQNYATLNYADACNGAGTGSKQFTVCPCSSSGGSSSGGSNSSGSSNSSASSGNSSSSGGSNSSGNSSGGSSSSSASTCNTHSCSECQIR